MPSAARLPTPLPTMPPVPRRQRTVGIAWAATALLIWAGWFGITRAGVRGTIGVADVAAMRLGVGSLLLLPIFVPGARRIPRHAWREAVILSATWGAPFILLLGRGIQLTSATHAAGLTPSSMPVFAGLLAWLFRGERPGAGRLLGYAIIAAAVLALSFGSNSSGMGAPASISGNLMLLAASALWAVYTLRVARSGLTALQATTLTCVYSAAAFLPVYVLAHLSRLAAASGLEVIVQLLYQGFLTGALATVAFTRAVALLGPASAAVITSLVPVVATLLAIPLAGEWPGAIELLADAAIAAGVLFATRAQPAPSRSTAG